MNKEDKILEILENLVDGQARIETKVDNLEVEVLGLKTAVGGLETRVESLETKVGNLETETKSLNTKVGNLEAEIGSLKTKVENLETETKNLKTEVSEVKDRTIRTSESVAVIEVEHGKMLGALSDGYSLMSDKMNKLIPAVDKIETISVDVSAIKSVVTSHAKTFSIIKNAI